MTIVQIDTNGNCADSFSGKLIDPTQTVGRTSAPTNTPPPIPTNPIFFNGGGIEIPNTQHHTEDVCANDKYSPNMID
ncbi:hypothetical protein ACFL0K_01230 [Patescibacteria group bacterium]